MFDFYFHEPQDKLLKPAHNNILQVEPSVYQAGFLYFSINDCTALKVKVHDDLDFFFLPTCH